MREIDFKIIETLEDLMDAMVGEAEKGTDEKKESKMPDSIKINISNDKYGNHGNGKMKRDNRDKEFWTWWDSLSDYEKDQETGR